MTAEHRLIEQKSQMRMEAAAQALMETETSFRLNLSGLLDRFFVPQSYDDTPVGSFVGLDTINLHWIMDNWFAYRPVDNDPLSFTRSSGQVIRPTPMLTDGGSVPSIATVTASLLGRTINPWVHLPAFLLHDWEFELHHCQLSQKSFDQVRDTMMEGVKTLMETGVVARDMAVFRAIYIAIDSFIARRIWDARPGQCTLPVLPTPDQIPEVA